MKIKTSKLPENALTKQISNEKINSWPVRPNDGCLKYGYDIKSKDCKSKIKL